MTDLTQISEHPMIANFLRYVGIDTMSVMREDPASTGENPSSPGQLELRKLLIEQMTELGLPEDMIMELDDGSLLVHRPATKGCQDAPVVCFSAHLDTAPKVPGKAVPIIHDWDGESDITLPSNGTVIPADQLPDKASPIITASGDTLLGADDKAGVAIMMQLIADSFTQKHGELWFLFCTDEEIGELDITVVPDEIVRTWDIIWTLDGEEIGPIDVGSIICNKVVATFKGVNAHPGVAGDQIRAANYAMIEMLAALLDRSNPMTTSGIEAFYFTPVIYESTPALSKCMLSPRSFDPDENVAMTAELKVIAERCAKHWDVELEWLDEMLAPNTRTVNERHPELMDIGFQAHLEHNIVPEERDVRGGTDGAMIQQALRDKGWDEDDLPAAFNMGTGAKNLHGEREYLSVSELLKAHRITLTMIEKYAVFEQD